MRNIYAMYNKWLHVVYRYVSENIKTPRVSIFNHALSAVLVGMTLYFRPTEHWIDIFDSMHNWEYAH